MSARVPPCLHEVPDEPDQAGRLARFRAVRTDVVVLVKRNPPLAHTPHGTITRPSVRELLDELETRFPLR